MKTLKTPPSIHAKIAEKYGLTELDIDTYHEQWSKDDRDLNFIVWLERTLYWKHRERVYGEFKWKIHLKM